MSDAVSALREEIARHPGNRLFLDQGLLPLFAASQTARLAVVGHAPSRSAQQSMVPWNDASGRRLMAWLGLEEPAFRDPGLVAHLPMDFYYQGKGPHGDLPPRRDFASLWHPRLFALMPDIRLTLLVGRHAQAYYLGPDAGKNLTVTVRAWKEYLPRYFPLVHPSPLNFRWLARNPWFEETLLPELKKKVLEALS